MAIPIDKKFVPCRHDDDMHAVGKYNVPNGCAVFPDDREQDLCGQHVINGGMNEGYELIVIFDIGFYKKYLGKTEAEIQADD